MQCHWKNSETRLSSLGGPASGAGRRDSFRTLTKTARKGRSQRGCAWPQARHARPGTRSRAISGLT
ncbi:hypothetical protein CSB93_2459 [Pseudomonas paraeruginosa]|uniref:Uncharacterized protein n=1 Tax=Pseudomonas paraeruginosa TaxID=2994495 RepID=A0A2R3IUB5_9PSED|nr:hypothetical protein CSB93_2459 [Pseudomonas paraeruginosa]AWE91126.1 hypothetical protein CSC28_1227 [Pseudomonas paraeruginosa]PTC38148.1 hypothetical protein CLJ1_1046 [Pseudomonas aeruginosa]